MKFLLISDTHGRLAIINDLVRTTQADAVIHAGDFGFYDESSYERLSERELRLHITHSDLSAEEKERLLGLPPAERIATVQTACPLKGHMGAPTCMVWNPFAIYSVEEATRRLQHGLEQARKASRGDPRSNSEWADEAYSFIGRIPEDMVHIGRGKKAPRWYRGMTHINLPDAHAGYAVLDVEGASTAIQTITSPLTA